MAKTADKSKLGEGGTLQGKEGHHNGLPSEVILKGDQEIRYHPGRNDSVHFHDDSKELKCVVPQTEWMPALHKLRTWQVQSWQYLDRKRGTLVRITAGKNEEGQFDFTICLTKHFDKTEPGPTLANLEKFTFPK